MIPREIFVTGTDTDVGKTVVSAVLTLGLDACYWKPVQAGTEPATDTELVRGWTGLPASRFLPEAYRLREPASPHHAASLEGIEIELERLVRLKPPPGGAEEAEDGGGSLAIDREEGPRSLAMEPMKGLRSLGMAPEEGPRNPAIDRSERSRSLVIEGAGGIMVPLNDRVLMADLIRELGAPAVLVARTSLGTLNHTLLSISEMRRRSIPLLGVILNGDPHPSNEAAIERIGEVLVLGRIPRLSELSPASLTEAFHQLRLGRSLAGPG